MRKKKLKKRVLTVLVLVAVTLLVSAFLSKQIRPASANDEAYQRPLTQTEVFISQIGETARQLGQANDLYASVMIAQAILESNSGRSALSAAPHHNLFGIKGQYAGQSATMPTLEDDGKGNTYKINAEFRSYPSYFESLQDYVAILKHSRYTYAWKSNTTSYMNATAALTGIYATDTSYNVKLNNLIQQYNLTQYDVPGTQTTSATASNKVYNPYRQQYTTQEVLNLDVAWANRRR
ncbi:MULTISPECIES: glucosaminidase domain-containing protein [unclassified Streptococcus]|uniref:glucosaminidase domain-containing protein n=1 Tax=unclassified Streptococcus TaxID=2608887 RepID=UPI0007357019|nr:MULTISPECIES: glucosaminidase domain-containing protein [unclassified Streptococcus]OFN53981.1 N-acetylmuramoyl-L-alanine amidase [Streptococcus sp. HMSC034B05]PNM83275.1 N-acetylmuramoyl-L-alanine amidase [Streptococcus sp. FDAARGOS_146]